MTTPCAHCGLPVEVEAPADGPAFCCTGCATVHAALVEACLSAFYVLRERLGADGGPSAPEASADRYRHFDDPAFLERFAPDGHRIELALEGVHCAACVWVVEQLPRVVPGVRRAHLDFGRARVVLDWDPEVVALSAVATELHRIGYPSSPIGRAGEVALRRADRRALIRLGVTAALAGNTMLLAFALYAGADADSTFGRAFEWLSLLLAIPAVTYGAWPFHRSAWAGLRLRVPHLDLPISLGLIGGFAASLIATLRGSGAIYYDSVTTLVFLLLAGRYLQQRGQRAAMNRAELLAALTPGRAQRWAETAFEEVPASLLRVGDRVRVRSGESLPADGEVLLGSGHVDQRLLTGEARPVPVIPGMHVFAGTVNLGEPIEVRVTAAGAETRVGDLMQRASAADDERAPLVQLTDRLAGRFVLGVLSLAIIGGISWGFAAPDRAFAVVVSLLVVTCPCALGLATPVALAVARGQAASAGILFRSTAAIERLAGIDRVCFDKTGTLTEGQLRVVDLAGQPAPGLIGRLAAVSVHPVSRALARFEPAGGRPLAEDVEEEPGVGVRGAVDGHRVEIGAPLRLHPTPLGGVLAEAEARAIVAGQTPVRIRIDGADAALAAVGDRVRRKAPPPWPA
ncbi:MAG: heavy metal translocating P-type ATPase [bacterium]